jgi:hypothetical protein
MFQMKTLSDSLIVGPVGPLPSTHALCPQGVQADNLRVQAGAVDGDSVEERGCLVYKAEALKNFSWVQP